MSWMLPTPLLLVAGAVALWPLAAIVRQVTSPSRLVAATFGTTLAVIGLVWHGRAALWWREQRSYGAE